MCRHFPVTVFLALLFLASYACKDKSTAFPHDYPGKQMHFGQGGGFTGQVNYFVLLDDGRLFKREQSDTSYVYRDKWKKRLTKQVFENYEKSGLDSVECKQPGNLYYFMSMHSPGVTPNVITWGAQGAEPPRQADSLYQVLYPLTTPRS